MEETKQTETKKQEAIRLAYQLINIPSEGVDDNGWKRISPGQFQGKYDLVDLLKINDSVHSIRPKSLSGIDDNRGWISINSGDNLPKEKGSYFTLTNYSKEIIERDYPIFTNSMNIEEENKWWLENITHYQRIIKPKPPIF